MNDDTLSPEVRKKLLEAQGRTEENTGALTDSELDNAAGGYAAEGLNQAPDLPRSIRPLGTGNREP